MVALSTRPQLISSAPIRHLERPQMISPRQFAFAIAALSIVACTPKQAVQPEAETAVAVPSPASESAQTAPLAAPSADAMSALDAPGSLLAQRVVYFDFDKSEIRPDMLEMLKAHAQFLVQNPSMKVRLEGHADERGTREYNIGLGDRRAQ